MVAYGAAIAACQKAKEWGVIMRLADNMTYEQVPKNRRVSALQFILFLLVAEKMSLLHKSG